jgi:hypothetical protein
MTDIMCDTMSASEHLPLVHVQECMPATPVVVADSLMKCMCEHAESDVLCKTLQLMTQGDMAAFAAFCKMFCVTPVTISAEVLTKHSAEAR